MIQSQNKEFFEEYLGDYEEFLKDEKVFREDLYPPYVRLAKITFAHKNGIKAKQEMEYYFNIIKNLDEIEVLNATEAAIFKVSNKYRYEILLRSKNINRLVNVLHSIDSPLAVMDMDTNY